MGDFLRPLTPVAYTAKNQFLRKKYFLNLRNNFLKMRKLFLKKKYFLNLRNYFLKIRNTNLKRNNFLSFLETRKI